MLAQTRVKFPNEIFSHPFNNHLARSRGSKCLNAVTHVRSTMTDYLQVQLYVLLLRSIAPISILHSIFLLVQPLLPPPLYSLRLPTPVTYWLVAEAAAYIFLYLPYKHYFLQLPAVHPNALSREERESLFARCWATVADPEKYLKQWFRGARKEDIKRENVREFIHWAFFNAEPVTEEDEREVEDYLTMIESRLGRAFLPGKGDAMSLRTTLDTVHCTHRSLFWYLVSHIPDTYWCWRAHCCAVYNSGRCYYLLLNALQRLSVLPHLSRQYLDFVSIPASHALFIKQVASKTPYVLASRTFVKETITSPVHSRRRCWSLSIH